MCGDRHNDSIRVRPYLDGLEKREINEFYTTLLKLGNLGISARVDNDIGKDIMCLKII